MNEPPRDYEKTLDLHESEWSKADKKEPIFGPGAFWFLRVIIPTAVLTLIFAYVWKTIVLALVG